MFKRSEESGSTKQLRKTKLIDSYKNIAKQKIQQPTTNRIMLTDLCPEEKAKIGELVKTLQLRKKQNKTLEEKIKQLMVSEVQMSQKIHFMQKTIEDHENREKQYFREIQMLKEKDLEREKYIGHLGQQLTTFKQKQFKRNTARADQYAMTEQVIKTEQGIQAAPKRKKQIEKEIQTDEIQIISRKNRLGKHPNTSKSYEKIMKKPKSHRVSIENIKYPTNSNHSNHQTSGYSLSRSQKRSNIRISDEEYSPENQKKTHQYGQNDSDQHEEQFDELARKWLQLKEKNMSKIKQSYKRSKQKFHSDVMPRQFGKGVYRYEQESFGPHKYKEESEEDEQKDDDYDEQELNKMLKNKNFSASRLLQKGSTNRVISEESEKKSHQKLQSQENRFFKERKQPANYLKQSNTSHSRQNIDFYETDLLDLVNSINPK